MDERIRFIAALKEEPECNFSRVCARFGIHRTTGYKWVARYEALGPPGLVDCEPVARSCPHATSPEIVDRVVALRKERPHDGPKKLRALLLERAPELAVPAASTIGDILDRNGLIRPRRKRLRVPRSASPLSHAVAANDLWCVDYKGDFPLDDGSRCYPLTITDAVSRYLIKCEGLPSTRDVLARPHFERAFREFGLPWRMRSDNGVPFATKTIGGLSSLSIWWIQLGITPERIEPGQPQQNGRHERMHLTLKQQTACPPKPTLIEQQREFDRFRHDYNDVRPHEALDQTPPARHYEPSSRSMPDVLRCPEYETGIEIRRVAPNGYLSWKGELMRVTRLLASQPVGLKLVDDDEWELLYGPVLLGYILVRDGKPRIEPLP